MNLQCFAGVFQAAAVSHINARHALRQTELNWSALFTLYIDKMSLLFRRCGAIGVVNTLLHPLGKITLKRAWLKTALLSSHFALERREEARIFSPKWVEAFKGPLAFSSACPSRKMKSTSWCFWSLGVLKVRQKALCYRQRTSIKGRNIIYSFCHWGRERKDSGA